MQPDVAAMALPLLFCVLENDKHPNEQSMALQAIKNLRRHPVSAVYQVRLFLNLRPFLARRMQVASMHVSWTRSRKISRGT